MSHDHKLVDVWGDGRAPIATEVTPDEAQEIIKIDSVSRYMQCSTCGIEVE